MTVNEGGRKWISGKLRCEEDETYEVAAQKKGREKLNKELIREKEAKHYTLAENMG